MKHIMHYQIKNTGSGNLPEYFKSNIIIPTPKITNTVDAKTNITCGKANKNE